MADREAAALPYASRALASFREAAKNQKLTAPTVSLAWFLLVGPSAELRNPGEAFRLARALSAEHPSGLIPGPFWARPATTAATIGLRSPLFRLLAASTGRSSASGTFMSRWPSAGSAACLRRERVSEKAGQWMKSNPTTKMHERMRVRAAAVMSWYSLLHGGIYQ